MLILKVYIIKYRLLFIYLIQNNIIYSDILN